MVVMLGYVQDSQPTSKNKDGSASTSPCIPHIASFGASHAGREKIVCRESTSNRQTEEWRSHRPCSSSSKCLQCPCYGTLSARFQVPCKETCKVTKP